MDRLVYVSSLGASHIERAQAIHANNLANVSTVGFRADLAQARAMQVFGDGHPTRVYALTEEPGIDFNGGAAIETGRNLDVMVSGDGFLAVQRGDGSEAYTRAGSLTVDAVGRLMTSDGLAVLGDGGPIVVPPYQQVTIGADGSVTVQPQGQGPEALVQVARLKLVNPDTADLIKHEDGLLAMRDDGLAPVDPGVQVASGFLESSNVNAVAEMTEIISLARQFELEVKMMRQAQDMEEAGAQLLRIG